MTALTVFSLFGGVLLLIYAMRLAGEGLQKAAGPRLRNFLMSAINNRIKAVGAGAVITALLQSSSATTVMLVGFVGSGLLGLSETMGVILGADIGTTLTVQIIAFKVYDYAIAIVGLGIAMKLGFKRSPVGHAGQAIVGFGLVFLSLKILIETFEPLTTDPLFSELLLGASSDPIIAIIVATLLTAILQSSAAVLGIAIGAAHTGLLPLESALPIVLGANIGTCATAVLASIGARADAKRVALAHILFKVIGVLLVLPFLGLFTELVSTAGGDLGRQVAVAHTAFNVIIAVIFLPFITPFTRLVRYLLPERETIERFAPRYLDPLVLASPALALGQATREALRVADIVQEMLRQTLEVFRKGDIHLIERIEEMENDVDTLDREIKLYLTKISNAALSEEEASREFEIMDFTNNMENIGDVIDKNLMELARKKIGKNLSFSSEGLSEIEELHAKVMENFDMGVAVFTGSNTELSHRLLSHKERFTHIEREMKEAHIERLHKGLKESIGTSAIHLDVLTNIKRINSYIANVAVVVLEREKK